MENLNEKIKKLEDDNQLKIITLEEHHQKSSAKVAIDNFKQKSSQLFEKFKDNENIKEIDLDNLKNDLNDAFEETLKALQSDELKSKAADTLKTMKRGFKIIAHEVGGNEYVKKVGDRVEEFANQESVKKVVNKTIEGSAKVLDSASKYLSSLVGKDN